MQPIGAANNMSLQARARTALARIKAYVPESVVAVVYAGRTAQGVADSVTADAALSVAGEQGTRIGLVRVDASELDRPASGSTITVAGVDCTVTEVVDDPAGALLDIGYITQKPVTIEQGI